MTHVPVETREMHVPVETRVPVGAGARLFSSRFSSTAGHRLLRELREAACHVCEAAAQWRAAGRHEAPLVHGGVDYLARMSHDLDFMGESEALVALIGTPRRLLRNNPLMLPRGLRAAELEADDAPPKNAEQRRLRRAEATLVAASAKARDAGEPEIPPPPGDDLYREVEEENSSFRPDDAAARAGTRLQAAWSWSVAWSSRRLS